MRLKTTAFIVFLAAVAVALWCPLAWASSGDRHPEFRQCVSTCVANDCSNGNNLPWNLRLLGWDCPENCDYKCSEWHTKKCMAEGKPVMQYHGMWWLIRIGGFQEIASMWFSIGNFGAHAFGFYYYRKNVDGSYRLRGLWLGYSVVSMNAWVWSTVFHARHFTFTERMDYFSASFALFYSVFATMIRIFPLQRKHLEVPLAALFVEMYVAYVLFLSLSPTFDYGLNMKVCCGLGVVYMLLWICESVRTRQLRGYFIWLYAFFIAILAGMSLELYDFSPYYGLFDAHSLWHAWTIPVSCFLYKFAVGDAKAALREKGGDGVYLPLLSEKVLLKNQ